MIDPHLQPSTSSAFLESSLLETKLFAPKAKADLIPRPELLTQLDKGLEVKLTMLSAPAGFGKTSLLSSWQASTGVSLAWVSLDEGDNDIKQFWLYVCAAFGKLESSLSRASLLALRSPETAPIKAVLTDLMNRLSAFSQQVVLVLDDYHVIHTAAIHESLGFFLEHLPANVHLFLLSRADPPLHISKLRARGEVVDVRAADLRFDNEEASRFFSQAFSLELNSHDLETLRGRTEGWAAGLRLAGLSLQGRDNPSNLIRAFAGSNRFILDYLAEEVLERQETELQTFLLQTSVLERLCAPLCDALTGGSNAQTQLERLEKANLFLIPLDDKRTWFRYHHLFADFLRTKLNHSHASEVPSLRQNAASWLEGRGLIEEALQHLFESENFEQAAKVLEAHSEHHLGRGTSNTIFRWLKKQPPETMKHHPLLCLYQQTALL
jgi:LuxR family transcriptional regulator, maltose regulon positive regulatory protein